MTERQANEIRARTSQAINDDTYLGVLPPWRVTGTKAGSAEASASN